MEARVRGRCKGSLLQTHIHEGAPRSSRDRLPVCLSWSPPFRPTMVFLHVLQVCVPRWMRPSSPPFLPPNRRVSSLLSHPVRRSGFPPPVKRNLNPTGSGFEPEGFPG
eukprot:scaffold348_cov329-Pavlova_lutheri.AAC.50